MGYYTEFTLTGHVYNGDKSFVSEDVLDSIDDEIRMMNVFDYYGNLEFGYSANTTWYEWKNDMCLLSSKFPDFIFCLHGVGEGYDDMWNAYFYQGEYQLCPAVIHYDEFDPAKLKESGCTSTEYSYR